MSIAAEPFRDRLSGRYGLICLAGLLILIGWAAFAPLAEGVVATGNLMVDNNRKSVQHLEGGIVRAVLVREGDFVREGQVVVELDDINARAQRDQAAKDVASLLLAQARLEAFLASASQVEPVDLDFLRLDPAVERDIRRHQSGLFQLQRRSLAANAGLLVSRKTTTLSASRAKQAQITAEETGLVAARNELALQESLLKQKLTRIDRVQELQRQVASQEADLARLRAEVSQGENQALEFDMEISASAAQVYKEASNELVKVKTDLLSTMERLASAEAVFERSRIRAPRSGIVLNLATTTVGGVIQSGQTLMEIVPENAKLIAEVHVSPNDRDTIYEGQDVKVQVSAYQSWSTPRLPGKLIGVSADLKHVKETGAGYYEARVELDPLSVSHEGLKIRAGMPVEAFIASGRKRTALDYMFEPLVHVVRRGAVAR